MRRNRAGSSDGLDGIEQDDKMRRLESRAIEVEQHMRTAEVQLGQAAAMFQRGELKAWRNALASSIAEAGQAAEVTIPSTAGLDENKASQMVQRITAARERAAVWTEHVLQVLPEPDMKLVVNFRETQQVGLSKLSCWSDQVKAQETSRIFA